MLRAGLPLCAVTLLNHAQLSADLLLAGVCLGAAAAGDYYLAAQVATAGLVLANAAGQAALARLAGLPPDSVAFSRRAAAEARVLLGCGGLLTLALLALGPPLLPLLFGDAHAAAGTALLALLPWFLLQHPTTLLQAALAATGRGDRALRANLLMLATLVPALAAAAASGSLAAFALARAGGEATRLAALSSPSRPGARRPASARPQPRTACPPSPSRRGSPARADAPATEAAACPAPRSCSPP
jgi:O-antigen/teichoic acid export membrane protein